MFETVVFSCIIPRMQQTPAEVSAILREFTPQSDDLNDIYLVKAAKSLGFKAKFIQIEPTKLDALILPAVGKTYDGSYFILARIKDNKALIQDVTTGQAQTVSLTMLTVMWTGELLHLTKRAGLLDAKTRFGFRWFIPALIKYRHLFADVLLASFFIQLVGLATPIFFQVTIDKVLVHKGMTTLDVLAVGFFAVITFEVLLTALRTYVFSHTTNRVDVELGGQLYRHMLSLPISYFTARRVGDTVARIKELDKVREFITGSSLTVVLDVLFSVVFFAVMFYYAPLLSWIIVGSIPCYILLSVLITPTLRAKLEQKFQKSAENHSFLVESVSGVETVKSLAVEPQMRNKWEEKLADYVSSSFDASHINNIYASIANYINKIVSLLTLYFGAIAVVDGSLTVGQFIAFNMLSQRVSGPIMRLVNLWQDFQQAKVSIERLGDVLNAPTEQGYNPNRTTLPNLQGQVSLQQVSFRYRPDSAPILNNVSLDINTGERIGIVGRSGSGKSTLTKLIQRLYVPQGGRVLIDGIDLALVEPAWLRRQVGVVLQESFLFNRSIRDNIALTEPGCSIEQVIQAATLAGAHEFICELTEGYDTIVGEHGASLSGGQRQRLAIARALIANPKILIFDEATSALDYESERIIQTNMAKISAGRTVFIIAHRLSAVRDCNRIIVMDKGQIAEQGSHAELLKQQGIYHYLMQIQHGAPASPATTAAAPARATSNTPIVQVASLLPQQAAAGNGERP
ncbi:type I secretion system permease/ATPase [Rheinheimera sp. MMS21-TC3]|uniref:type I secretion system permease/ATPase n=1 Tax=Rheinheimera sp. MMS21-TC3 TaxID=3072790 RepID=UPI0028C43D1A|nr:type I secretion system permease/ATPase [Rheinheimera sp. MMS21-TC3]WNO61035.1 type I secretion system permease/ATPase [Rheinheimera sp. MMS21-TC3]